MGFLAASASICHFEVLGNLKEQNQRMDILEQLAKEGFRSIEQSTEEQAIGWVHLDDYETSDFSSELSCWREQYLCFSLRQDRRRIPAALYKREVKRLSEQFLAGKPTFNRVPKAELEQIRDQARSLLMARTLPTPAFYDVVWDSENNLLRLCSLSQAVIDSFQGLFHQTFPDLRLQLLHPFSRAAKIIPSDLQEALQQTNQAQTDSTLEQIEANRWLGSEFLQWLFFRTLNSDSGYRVTTPGPLLSEQPFTAFLDHRLVLLGGGQDGPQKVVVSGQQDQYSEVRAALLQGKEIEEATLHLRQDDEEGWKLTLKGERFQFGSYRTPMVKPDGDPNDDPQAEAAAAFYTKVGAVEEGEQMFESLLQTFLKLRLTESWTQTQKEMTDWLHS